MRQIRARIRDKRGADYTEAEIRELANVKLDKFLDPRAVRSDLLLHYRQQRRPANEAPMPLYAFDPSIVYVSDRGTPGRILSFIRKLLNPILKLFFNPTPLLHVVHLQTQINDRVNKALVTREEFDALNFEMFNNLVVELTRLGVEVRNLRMQVESFGTRLDFDERRARALEGAVQYKPGAPVARPPQPPAAPAAAQPQTSPGQAPAGDDGGDDEEGVDGETGRARRRRRRRGRRRGQGLPGEGGDGQSETQGDGQADAGSTASASASAGDGARPSAAFTPREGRGGGAQGAYAPAVRTRNDAEPAAQRWDTDPAAHTPVPVTIETNDWQAGPDQAEPAAQEWSAQATHEPEASGDAHEPVEPTEAGYTGHDAQHTAYDAEPETEPRDAAADFWRAVTAQPAHDASADAAPSDAASPDAEAAHERAAHEGVSDETASYEPAHDVAASEPAAAEPIAVEDEAAANEAAADTEPVAPVAEEPARRFTRVFDDATADRSSGTTESAGGAEPRPGDSEPSRS